MANAPGQPDVPPSPDVPTPAAGQPPRREGVPLRPLPKPLALKPKRVRGGLRYEGILEATPPPAGLWAAQRWLRLVELAADGEALRDGLEYAKLGQTRRWVVLPGRVEASVQGRAPRAYTTVVRLTSFTPEQWERIVANLSENASYAAKLLSGELPTNIEEAFAPAGLRLFPAEPSDVVVSCTCGGTDIAGGMPPGIGIAPGVDPASKAAWCQHVCAVAHLLAEALATKPFLLFALRGLDGEEIVERLRQRRAVVSTATGATPVYQQRVQGVSDVEASPLDANLGSFWSAGPGLEALDLPMAPPEVSHPILRRLGASPFPNGVFPMVGLLASCYEFISENVLQQSEAEDAEQQAEHAGEPAPEPTDDPQD